MDGAAYWEVVGRPMSNNAMAWKTAIIELSRFLLYMLRDDRLEEGLASRAIHIACPGERADRSLIVRARLTDRIAEVESGMIGVDSKWTMYHPAFQVN